MKFFSPNMKYHITLFSYFANYLLMIQLISAVVLKYVDSTAANSALQAEGNYFCFNYFLSHYRRRGFFRSVGRHRDEIVPLRELLPKMNHFGTKKVDFLKKFEKRSFKLPEIKTISNHIYFQMKCPSVTSPDSAPFFSIVGWQNRIQLQNYLHFGVTPVMRHHYSFATDDTNFISNCFNVIKLLSQRCQGLTGK